MNELSNAKKLALKISRVCYRAVEKIGQSTGQDATKRLIKQYIKVMDGALDKVKNTPGMLTEDVSAIEAQLEELRSISGRNIPENIRSWEAKSVMREDAKLVMGKAMRYWSSVATQAEDENAYRMRAARSHQSTPNYRYKIGQMVKVGNRYGKVVGASLEGGTGKQMYDVKLTSNDNIVKCTAAEMKGVSDNNPSTKHLDFI